LNKADTCPRWFYLTEITGEVHEHSSEAAETGREVHEVLAAEVVGDSNFNEMLEAYSLGCPEVRQLVDTCIALRSKAFGLSLPSDPVERRITVNRDWQLVSDDAEDAWFTGRPDWWRYADGVLRLCDYKSGWSVYQAQQDRDMQQLRRYLPLINAMVEEQMLEANLGVIYPRISHVETQHFVGAELDTMLDLITEGIDRDVQAIQETIAASDPELWPARPGCQHCAVCGCGIKCPAWIDLELTDSLSLADPDLATKAAGVLAMLEQRVKGLKDRLKVYVDEHGPVEVGDKQLGFQRTESVSVDVELFLQLAAAVGVPEATIWKAVGLTGTELKKLEKKYPGTESACTGAITRKASPRFGWSKAKGEENED
jgi:hypothetical protein